MINIANSNHVDLIAKARIDGLQRGFFLQSGNTFQSDRASETRTRTQLLDIALAGEPVTFTVVANGMAQRLGVDLDFDGIFDGDAGPIVVNPGDQTIHCPVGIAAVARFLRLVGEVSVSW